MAKPAERGEVSPSSIPCGSFKAVWYPDLLWPVLVGLLLRVAMAAVWEAYTGGKFAFGDSHSYWVLGRAIALGEEYLYGNARIFRMPGYPLFLAPLFWIFGADFPPVVARLFGAFLGTLTIVGVYQFGSWLFDRHVGQIAAWIAAAYPGAVVLSVLILSEALFCPLMIFGLVAMVKGAQAKNTGSRAWWWLGAGVLHGWATLTRPSWLIFPLFSSLVICILSKQRPRDLGYLLLLAIGVLATLSPWFWRNWCLTGRFVPTTLQVGASLFDGLHADATGASDLTFVSRRMAEIAQEFSARRPTSSPDRTPANSLPTSKDSRELINGQGITDKPATLYGNTNLAHSAPASMSMATDASIRPENPKWSTYAVSEEWARQQRWSICPKISDKARFEIDLELFLDQRLRQEALAWAWENPRQVLVLAIKKLARMWNIWPNEPSFQSWQVKILVAATFLPVITLSILGIIRFRRGGWLYWLPALPAIYLTGIHCIFVSSLRYREPAVLALIPPAVAGGRDLAKMLRRRWQKKSPE